MESPRTTPLTVFQILDSQACWSGCASSGYKAFAGQIEGVVAIDGKSLRGSRSGKQSPLHIVSAWACQNSMLLGRYKRTKNPTRSRPSLSG